MSLNPPKVKSIWYMRYGGSGFYVVGPGGITAGGELNGKRWTRMELADFAFDHGADEIIHGYDLLAFP